MRHGRFNRRPRSTNRSLCERLESRVLLSALPAMLPAAPVVAHHAVKQADERDDSFFSDAWDDVSGSSDTSTDSSSSSSSSDSGGSFWDDLGNAMSGPSTQPAQPDNSDNSTPQPPVDDSGSYDSGSYDSGGDTTYTTIYNYWCPPAPSRPGTPYGVTAKALNATTVRLTWCGDTFNTTGYCILRIGPGKVTSVVGNVNGLTTAFVDVHAQANSTYIYAVSAYNFAGTSGYSRPVSVTTPAAVPVSLPVNHGVTLKLPTSTPIRTVTPSVDRPSTGFVDVANRSTLSGWAFDADFGAAPIAVRYSIDNGPARFAVANGARSDLVAHVGSANHGFTIKLPKLTSTAHLVTVFAIDPSNGKLTLLGRRWIAHA